MNEQEVINLMDIAIKAAIDADRALNTNFAGTDLIHAARANANIGAEIANKAAEAAHSAIQELRKEELANYKEGCEGLKLAIQDLRPLAECYRRVCESLGIDKNILGYVNKMRADRDVLYPAILDYADALANATLLNDKNSNADADNKAAAAHSKIRQLLNIEKT